MMMGVTAVRKYDDGGSVVIIIQLCSVAKQFNLSPFVTGIKSLVHFVVLL